MLLLLGHKDAGIRCPPHGDSHTRPDANIPALLTKDVSGG
jgi:hypothetical protein